MTYPHNPTTTGPLGVQLIKDFEGLNLRAYKCPAGKWTIGYGTTAGVKEGDIVTTDEAEELLRRDIRFFEAGVAKAVNVKIRQNQFDALVSFAYNVGLGNFKKSTLLRLLNEGKDTSAADQFLRWKFVKGVESGGLLRRRRAERELFIS